MAESSTEKLSFEPVRVVNIGGQLDKNEKGHVACPRQKVPV